MKVLHTIQGLGISSGGPSHSVFYTVKGLNDIGLPTKILSFSLDEGDHYVSEEDFIVEVPKGSFLKSFKTYNKYLKNNLSDIYHSQGIWNYTTYLTAKVARKKHKVYIITPRGMLYPQALQKSKWKKKIFLSFSLFKDMQKAACIQATCIEEMQHIRSLGVTSPIAVIPNPVDIPKIDTKKYSPQKRIGYLGRVHPRKNIERVLYSLNLLKGDINDVEFLIIGGGDDDYLNFLKTEVARLNLNNVIFTGFLSGKEKEEAINSLDYLVVPSDFENFGMIIAEALVRKIPVITSKGTPWADLVIHDCGWWIDNDVNSISEALRSALLLSDEEAKKKGKNGRQLIINEYSPEVISRKMNELYSWILNGGKKPEFVYL